MASEEEVAPTPHYSTFRIFGEDGANLIDLARERKKTVAELYRELLAPVVREQLIPVASRRLEKLKAGA
jgi:hypothetical protein